MITNYGSMDIMVHCDFTPLTGENFIELCEKKYYNETKFHRLVKNFVVLSIDFSNFSFKAETQLVPAQEEIQFLEAHLMMNSMRS